MNPAFCAFSFYSFWNGYRATCWDNRLLKKYLMLEIPFFFLLVIAWIAPWLNFDGIVYLCSDWGNGHFWIPTFFVLPECVVLGFG
jgi:hypothetical protein